MRVGEVISLLTKFASLVGEEGDDLLMAKSVYSINVNSDNIELFFVDDNTSDYKIIIDENAVLKKEYL